jgi:hypothetical protein
MLLPEKEKIRVSCIFIFGRMSFQLAGNEPVFIPESSKIN